MRCQPIRVIMSPKPLAIKGREENINKRKFGDGINGRRSNKKSY